MRVAVPKGKKAGLTKKIAKNVYLKEAQIKYIMQKCGGEGNFSPFLSQVIDLYIALSDTRILKKLDQESINLLVAEINEDYVRKTYIKSKVLEYPEIFEQMAKNSRYLIPNVDTLVELFIPIMEHFQFLEYDKMRVEDFDNLKKIIRQNNLFDDFDLQSTPDSVIITIKGKNPYSLLWYSKILSLAISHLKSHFKVTKLETNETKSVVRITTKKAPTKEEALLAVKEHFSNTKIMINDSEDNLGIWNLLNNNLNIILDKEFLADYIKSCREGISTKVVPFNDLIDLLKTQDNWENTKLIFKFYEKLSFVSNLSFDKNKISFSTTLPDVTFPMLTTTFDHLSIPYKLEKKYATSTLTLL